jgi:hypothetical protein
MSKGPQLNGKITGNEDILTREGSSPSSGTGKAPLRRGFLLAGSSASGLAATKRNAASLTPPARRLRVPARVHETSRP